MKKTNILFVAPSDVDFDALEKAFNSHPNFICDKTDSSEAAKKYVKENKVDVVVAAEQLPDETGLSCVQEVVKMNPFINCALCSSADPDDFHEFTEGYGVVMQFSVTPTVKETYEFIEKLSKIYQLTGESEQ